MSNRDLGVGALGRFLAVERYRESQQSSFSTYPSWTPGADRTGGHAAKPGSGSARSGSRGPARPQHG